MAEHFSTEIISADSRQFYREMRIGTAAPEKAQLRAVKHHFIGHLSIHNSYNVSMYEQDALKTLHTLFKSKPLAIACGGSGLFLDALCEGIDQLPDPSSELRSNLQQQLEKSGLGALLTQLEALDPVFYSQLDKNNPRRVLRALEVCLQTGLPYSSFRKREATQRDFRILRLCLDMPREELHHRIHLRTEEMFEKGFLEESRELLPHRELNALNTLGYKELFSYFDGLYSMEEAKEKIKTNTRRYARRQLTWFRKNSDYHWFHPEQIQEISTLLQQNQ